MKCWMDSLAHHVAHLVLGFCFVLVGCAAPQPILDADRAGDTAMANYAHNVQAIARAALDAWKREALAAARYKWRTAMDAASAGTGSVPRELIEEAQKELDRIAGEIDAEVGRAEAALAKAQLDLADAEAFRAEVRAWLSSGGVAPETARALADLIEDRWKGTADAE